MCAKCRQHGFHVRKEDVCLVSSWFPGEFYWHLRRRTSSGTWIHMIKPFGICINGCIDGFSRKMIWLNAYTRSDPKLIRGYYTEAVQALGGCPRGDLGTENYLSPRTQIALWTVTWRKPIKELNIGGVFFASSAWSCGSPCLYT